MKEYKKRDAARASGRRTEGASPLAGGMPSLTEGAGRRELPEAMRTKMENAFGADFSNLRIYESERVAEGGAKAVTQGNTIAFAPGEFNPYSPHSEALLGHELSHVVSQARGEAGGSGLLDNAYLEAKADREGVMAAAGQQVYTGPVTPISASSPMSVAGPMQCKRSKEQKNLKKSYGQQDTAGKISSLVNMRMYQEFMPENRLDPTRSADFSEYTASPFDDNRSDPEFIPEFIRQYASAGDAVRRLHRMNKKDYSEQNTALSKTFNSEEYARFKAFQYMLQDKRENDSEFAHDFAVALHQDSDSMDKIQNTVNGIDNKFHLGQKAESFQYDRAGFRQSFGERWRGYQGPGTEPEKEERLSLKDKVRQAINVYKYQQFHGQGEDPYDEQVSAYLEKSSLFGNDVHFMRELQKQSLEAAQKLIDEYQQLKDKGMKDDDQAKAEASIGEASRDMESIQNILSRMYITDDDQKGLKEYEAALTNNETMRKAMEIRQAVTNSSGNTYLAKGNNKAQYGHEYARRGAEWAAEIDPFTGKKRGRR